jgi:hypothetical protein
LNSTAYTKTAWINLSSSSDQDIISGTASPSDDHRFWITGGKLSAGHNGTWGAAQDSTTLVTHSWHHVAVTYDSAVSGGKLTLHKDGKVVGMATSISQPIGTGLQIGAYHIGTSLFEGMMATAQIYSRGLSSAEILQNCLMQEKRYTSTAYSICGVP